jgi:uncharacterized protein HemX
VAADTAKNATPKTGSAPTAQGDPGSDASLAPVLSDSDGKRNGNGSGRGGVVSTAVVLSAAALAMGYLFNQDSQRSKDQADMRNELAAIRAELVTSISGNRQSLTDTLQRISALEATLEAETKWLAGQQRSLGEQMRQLSYLVAVEPDDGSP